MPEPAPVIRETTARNFLKDRTGLRVGEDAVERFVGIFTALAVAIAETADGLVKAEDRTTILERDIQQAYDEYVHSGPQVIGPDAILAAVNDISNKELGKLIQLLRADLTTTPGTPP